MNTELSAYNGTTVVVAGGAGFVGSALCRELLAVGCSRVVALDNFLHGVPENVTDVDPRLVLRRTDLLDEIELAMALRDLSPEFVFNCVGDTFVPAAYEMPTRFLETNTRAHLNLLRACRTLPIRRILYVSSTEVYGEVSDGHAIDEQTPLNPLNTYAVTKLAADRLSHTFALEHGSPVVIARIFNTYGPRESQPYIVPEIFRQLHRHGSLRLGNVDAIRDFTWVHDTCRALLAIAVAPVPHGEAINVGSGEGVSIRALAALAGDVAGVSSPEVAFDASRVRARDIERFVCDNRKLKELTGWRPSVSLEEGLSNTWRWYAAHDFTWSWERFVSESTVWR